MSSYSRSRVNEVVGSPLAGLVAVFSSFKRLSPLVRALVDGNSLTHARTQSIILY